MGGLLLEFVRWALIHHDFCDGELRPHIVVLSVNECLREFPP